MFPLFGLLAGAFICGGIGVMRAEAKGYSKLLFFILPFLTAAAGCFAFANAEGGFRDAILWAIGCGLPPLIVLRVLPAKQE